MVSSSTQPIVPNLSHFYYRLITEVRYQPKITPPTSELALPQRVVISKPLLSHSSVPRDTNDFRFKAQITLRFPLVYESGSSIPYKVTIFTPDSSNFRSEYETTVAIVKTSKVFVEGKSYQKTETIGIRISRHSGSTLGVADANNNEPITIEESCTAGKQGLESSWKVEDVASVSVIVSQFCFIGPFI